MELYGIVTKLNIWKIRSQFPCYNSLNYFQLNCVPWILSPFSYLGATFKAEKKKKCLLKFTSTHLHIELTKAKTQEMCREIVSVSFTDSAFTGSQAEEDCIFPFLEVYSNIPTISKI